MKRPASQYYWGDWRRDTALQACSLAARGLWHEMNCLMHDCEPYGHLMVGSAPMSPAQLARLVGISGKEVAIFLAELSAAGVFSVAEKGSLFSRRMVRDEVIREKRAAAGYAGAEHGVKGASHGIKGGRPTKVEGVAETPLTVSKEPPPAFASAFASASAPARSLKPTPKVKTLSPGATLPAAPTAETWAAYSEAYEAAYSVKPVRNAQVNGQLSQLVARLGAVEAPEVARWFLRHRNGLYVSAMHSVNLLLRDAEKLRTEWATGRQVTRTQAQQQDRTQTNLSAFAGMLAEAEQRELLNGKH